MADTIGRRRTIVLSMFSGAVSMLFLSQARTFPVILLLTLLTGLTGELYRPASSALLADLIEPGHRITAYSAYRIAFNAGWAFGPATAGLLAAHGFGWLFVGDAATSALFGVVAWCAIPRSGRKGTRGVGWSDATFAPVFDRRFGWLLLAAFIVAALFFQICSTLSLYTTQVGLSASAYAFVLSLNGALVALCELPLTTLTRRFPARAVIATGYAVAGLGVGLIASAHTVSALVLCMAILTLGEMVAMPVCSAYVADLAPPHLRGRYLGAYAMTWSAGMMAGPAVGMRLFEIHPALVWIVFGGLGCVASAIVLAASKEWASDSTPAKNLLVQKQGF